LELERERGTGGWGRSLLIDLVHPGYGGCPSSWPDRKGIESGARGIREIRRKRGPSKNS
jgi:hypothetical protein